MISSHPTVVIIGAGPYGLSIAAHLQSEGVDFRIFGMPMQRWLAHMPKGMFLKSEGCASNLFDPTGYTLRQYCGERGLPYGQYGAPVSIEVFTQYGLAFQRRVVPAVENVMVTALDRSAAIFKLRLASGETLTTHKVVVATGMTYTACIPEALAHLPGELLSHSGNHHDLSGFKGRNVTVIGGGQSALETAALLHETGADVRLIVRRSSILWNKTPTQERSVYARTRHPMSKLGPGLGPWFYSNSPGLFRYLPRQVRIARVRKALGPAGAWWLRDRVEGLVPTMLGHVVQRAESRGERILLHLQGDDGAVRQLTTNHVIAATGYRFDLRSLPFLSDSLLSQLQSLQQTPILSPNFESSVSGLYFTGLASANQFGPAMRFLHGADYTARRVSRHIKSSTHRFRSLLSAGPSHAPKCQEFSTDEVSQPVA
jgi:thioredoxin reductase